MIAGADCKSAGTASRSATTEAKTLPFHALRALLHLPARLLLLLIWLYQRTLSPALPILTMGRCGCRFAPTCSHYAADAIRTHGAIRGSLLAVVRLGKCTPLHPGGFDPVPPRRMRCERVAPATAPATHLPPTLV